MCLLTFRWKQSHKLALFSVALNLIMQYAVWRSVLQLCCAHAFSRFEDCMQEEGTSVENTLNDH